MSCFWQLGVFNVIAGLWNTLTRKKHNHKHQKLNLLPFPALLSSLFDFALPHHLLSPSLSIIGFFHLPFSPSFLCFGLPLFFPLVSGMWLETQYKKGERQPSHQLMWRRCQNNLKPLNFRKMICLYSGVLCHSTLSSLPPSLNFHFSLKGRWHGRLMSELITHSMLYLIIPLYMSSKSVWDCAICSLVLNIKTCLHLRGYLQYVASSLSILFIQPFFLFYGLSKAALKVLFRDCLGRVVQMPNIMHCWCVTAVDDD